MITTTLKEIRAKSPCTDGWETLLKHLDKTGAEAKSDETPLPVMTVLESNGMEDALWVLDNCINPRICILFACDCAERVLHIFEDAMPNDDRPRKAIEVARNPNSTTSARDAAWAAAGAAAWDAARAAARAAAWDAAWAAVRAAARAAAWAAVRDAAWDAARAAARAAAGDAEKSTQEKRLIQYLTHGEAAADMEWPT